MKSLTQYITEAARKSYDLNKEFSHGLVKVTRQDFENLPEPLAAEYVSDIDMQAIVDTAYEALAEYQDFYSSDGTNYEASDVYSGAAADSFADLDDAVAEDAEMNMWTELEEAAIKYGMKYRSDLK